MAENPLIHFPCENVIKLTDMLPRIDERCKINIDGIHEVKEQIRNVNDVVNELNQKIAVVYSNRPEKELAELSSAVVELDKRITKLEDSSGKSKDRWNQISVFVIQLAWVVLAAWVLTKLNLQSPAIP